MLANLILETLPWFASGGTAALAWYVRGAMGKVRDPKPTPKDMSLMEVMQNGNKIVAQMAADVHKLYHPPGEDGKPCACAICEITADDDPAPEPAPEPEEKPFAPAYVKALQQKLDGLRKENASLRKGSGERVITKTVERKTALQNQIEQAAAMVTDIPLTLTLEPSDMTNGHPMSIVIGRREEPDQTIVKHGGEVVRNIWHPRPQSGPGSKELGIMDRQIGTFFRDCDKCGDTGWKIVGPDVLCKNCWYSMPKSEYGIPIRTGRK